MYIIPKIIQWMGERPSQQIRPPRPRAGKQLSVLPDYPFQRVRLQTEATPDRATSSLLSGSAADSLRTHQRARNPEDHPGASRSGAACPSTYPLHPPADQPRRADTRSRWQNTSLGLRQCAVWTQRLGRVPRRCEARSRGRGPGPHSTPGITAFRPVG